MLRLRPSFSNGLAHASVVKRVVRVVTDRAFCLFVLAVRVNGRGVVSTKPCRRQHATPVARSAERNMRRAFPARGGNVAGTIM